MTSKLAASSRRQFMRHGVALFSFLVSGGVKLLAPAEARAFGAKLRIFDSDQVRTVDSLGETLLPGSAVAGLAHFIDVQLAGSAVDSMLMIRYLGLNPPYKDFYTSGIDALNAAARTTYSQPFSSLEPKNANALVTAMAKGEITGWKGPPAPLFYFVMRNDAVDVTYGTVAGCEALGVPYMAHIAPPTRWGE
jgi:hypothetical protein